MTRVLGPLIVLATLFGWIAATSAVLQRRRSRRSSAIRIRPQR